MYCQPFWMITVIQFLLNLLPFSLFDVSPFYYYLRIYRWFLCRFHPEYCTDTHNSLYYARRPRFPIREPTVRIWSQCHQFLLSFTLKKISFVDFNQYIWWWKSNFNLEPIQNWWNPWLFRTQKLFSKNFDWLWLFILILTEFSNLIHRKWL